MVEIERRTLKTKRLYDEAFERYRQRDSGIKQLRQKILPKVNKILNEKSITIILFFISV